MIAGTRRLTNSGFVIVLAHQRRPLAKEPLAGAPSSMPSRLRSKTGLQVLLSGAFRSQLRESAVPAIFGFSVGSKRHPVTRTCLSRDNVPELRCSASLAIGVSASSCSTEPAPPGDVIYIAAKKNGVDEAEHAEISC